MEYTMSSQMAERTAVTSTEWQKDKQQHYSSLNVTKTQHNTLEMWKSSCAIDNAACMNVFKSKSGYYQRLASSNWNIHLTWGGAKANG